MQTPWRRRSTSLTPRNGTTGCRLKSWEGVKLSGAGAMISLWTEVLCDPGRLDHHALFERSCNAVNALYSVLVKRRNHQRSVIIHNASYNGLRSRTCNHFLRQLCPACFAANMYGRPFAMRYVTMSLRVRSSGKDIHVDNFASSAFGLFWRCLSFFIVCRTSCSAGSCHIALAARTILFGPREVTSTPVLGICRCFAAFPAKLGLDSK